MQLGLHGYVDMSGIEDLDIGFSNEDLIKLTEWRMPFGKYVDYALIDLPEEYLFWFEKKGFPKGELGKLMALTLGLKIEGLDKLLKSLKNKAYTNSWGGEF
jgi:uncharacterized protein (DUF3820 family)